MMWKTICTVVGSHGDEYQIKQHPMTGMVGCTCKGWRYSKKNPRECTHLRQWMDSELKRPSTISALEIAPVLTPQTVADTDEETYEFLREINL